MYIQNVIAQVSRAQVFRPSSPVIRLRRKQIHQCPNTPSPFPLLYSLVKLLLNNLSHSPINISPPIPNRPTRPITQTDRKRHPLRLRQKETRVLPLKAPRRARLHVLQIAPALCIERALAIVDGKIAGFEGRNRLRLADGAAVDGRGRGEVEELAVVADLADGKAAVRGGDVIGGRAGGVDGGAGGDHGLRCCGGGLVVCEGGRDEGGVPVTVFVTVFVVVVRDLTVVVVDVVRVTVDVRVWDAVRVSVLVVTGLTILRQ